MYLHGFHWTDFREIDAGDLYETTGRITTTERAPVLTE
jgi:hypothetical protein